MSDTIKTLEYLINMAADVVIRLNSVTHPDLNDEEGLVIAKMKSQVEILVTDLVTLFSEPEQDRDEIENLQTVLLNMNEATKQLTA